MKVAAFFLCILLVASCKNQQESAAEEQNSAVVQIKQPSEDLYAQIGFKDSTIQLGKVVSFDNNQIIYFTNEGNNHLIIEEVYTQTDRIEVFGFTYEIAPGEQGKIRIRIDEGLEHQGYSDSIFIRANSGNSPSLARLEINYELSNNLVIGGIFIEEKDRINVRMFPSLEASVIFGLEKGDEITCIGAMRKEYVEDFDSDLWYYVNYKGRKGWVLSALTDFKQQEVIAMN